MISIWFFTVFQRKMTESAAWPFSVWGKREVLAVSTGRGEDGVGGSVNPTSVWQEGCLGGEGSLFPLKLRGGLWRVSDGAGFRGRGRGFLFVSSVPDLHLHCCIRSCPQARLHCCVSARCSAAFKALLSTCP